MPVVHKERKRNRIAAPYAAGELPEGFPSDPATVYAGRWRGWPAFLGTGKPESA